MKVLKFGGTSVGSSEAVLKVINIVGKEVGKGTNPFVIFSAFGGVTNKLEQLAENAIRNPNKNEKILLELRTRHIDTIKKLVVLKKQSIVIAQIISYFNELEDILDGVFLLKELSKKTRDKILSYGERMSCYIISEAFTSKGYKTKYVDTRDYIVTDQNFGSAKIDIQRTYKNIQKLKKESDINIFVVTGFIAKTYNEDTSTLGRGGSDYTASIFGSALLASSVEIWTDVDGVMSCNPKLVNRAFTIKRMTYNEAIEMSHFGSKVIYHPTILPLMKKKIPLYIKNTFNPKNEGTLIGNGPYKIVRSPIKGISVIDDICIIRIEGGGMIGVAGIAHRIYQALYQENINIVLITQSSSEHSITIAVSPDDAIKAEEKLNSEFELEIKAERIEKIKIENGFSIVAVVGENMRDIPGMSGKVFKSLGDFNINVVAIAQGSSKLNISIVIKKESSKRALNAIHDTFFFPLEKIINVFQLGVGNIGGTLINQIIHNNNKQQDNKIINLISLANSEKYITNDDGLELKSAIKNLKKSERKSNINFFINQVKSFNYPNKVFVDCTSSQDVSSCYRDLLESGVNIVTANKKANSDSFDYYNELKIASKKKGVKFLYETNVGAGLPIIKTIQNLVNSGDEIISVQAVLSGSLAFIISSLHEGKSFSEIMKTAMENGYTEPNPKDDLDGMDFVRKLVIIAREIGLKTEIKDVDLEYLIPEQLLEIEDKKEFVNEIMKLDSYFDKKIKSVIKNNKKLCYIGGIEKGKAYLKVKEIDSKHPFYILNGTDNIITIKTKYYPNGKTVLGSGAGRDVTSSGVLANIVESI